MVHLTRSSTRHRPRCQLPRRWHPRHRLHLDASTVRGARRDAKTDVMCTSRKGEGHTHTHVVHMNIPFNMPCAVSRQNTHFIASPPTRGAIDDVNTASCGRGSEMNAALTCCVYSCERSFVMPLHSPCRNIHASASTACAQEPWRLRHQHRVPSHRRLSTSENGDRTRFSRTVASRAS